MSAFEHFPASFFGLSFVAGSGRSPSFQIATRHSPLSLTRTHTAAVPLNRILKTGHSASKLEHVCSLSRSTRAIKGSMLARRDSVGGETRPPAAEMTAENGSGGSAAEGASAGSRSIGGGEGSLPPAESAGEGSMGARTSSALSGAVMAAESAGSSPSAMVRARLGRVTIVRTRSADVVSGRKKRLISRRVGILAGGR